MLDKPLLLSEQCHQFDLHGCIVFDDFIPISFCPSKGIVGSLSVLPRANLLSGNGEEKFNMKNWETEAQSILNKNKKDSLCVVGLTIPFDCLEALTPLLKHNSQKRFLSSLHDVKRSFVHLAERALDLREQRAHSIESLSNYLSPKSIAHEDTYESESSNVKDLSPHDSRQTTAAAVGTHNSKYNFGTYMSKALRGWFSSEEDCGGKVIKDLKTLQKKDTEEFDAIDNESDAYTSSDENVPEDVEHVVNFLQNLTEQSDPPSHNSKVTSWLSCLTAFLKTTEQLHYCTGVILLVQLPSNYPPSYVDIPAHISKEFRQELQLPVVTCNLSAQQYEEILYLCTSSSVVTAALTPIPLHRGDHVYRQMRSKGALKLIQHHGIYTGNGRLIHFSGNEMSLAGLIGKQTLARIRSVSILKFMGHGSRLKVRKYKQSQPPDDVIMRAEEALQQQSFPAYNLLKNNCEHFCYYCKTGKSRSKQVEKGIKFAAVASAVALTATALAVASQRKR